MQKAFFFSQLFIAHFSFFVIRVISRFSSTSTLILSVSISVGWQSLTVKFPDRKFSNRHMAHIKIA